MTVRCLDQSAKNAIVHAFTATHMKDLNDIASCFGVSRRTIVRVLEEAGVDPGIRRRKSKEVQENDVQFPLPLGEPWFKDFSLRNSWLNRVFNKVKQVFAVPTMH